MSNGTGIMKLMTDAGDFVNCRVADTFWTRFMGLMGSPRLPHREGLLIRPCNSIHMFFMRFPIDAVFLDREFRIVKLIKCLEPGKVVGTIPGAWQVLEVVAGDLPESFDEGVMLSVA